MITLIVYGVLALLWLAVIVLASTWPDGCSGPDERRTPHTSSPGAPSPPNGPEQPSPTSSAYRPRHAAARPRLA